MEPPTSKLPEIFTSGSSSFQNTPRMRLLLEYFSILPASSHYSRFVGLISPIKKKSSKVIPITHSLSQASNNNYNNNMHNSPNQKKNWTIGKAPAIPQFVLPSSAVTCKPFVLLIMHGNKPHTCGIFPDERSAKDKKRQLMEERKKQMKMNKLFLSSDWKNNSCDYIVTPL